VGSWRARGELKIGSGTNKGGRQAIAGVTCTQYTKPKQNKPNDNKDRSTADGEAKQHTTQERGDASGTGKEQKNEIAGSIVRGKTGRTWNIYLTKNKQKD
jgi:hypothetical protein